MLKLSYEDTIGNTRLILPAVLSGFIMQREAIPAIAIIALNIMCESHCFMK